MEEMCYVLPVLPGQTEAARRFLWEMGHSRLADFDSSQRRIGITHESWYLMALPDGDYLIVFMQGVDFARMLALLAQSEDEFDRWFNERLIETTGIDISNPPEMEFPEMLLNYSA
jgi:hypothetical protein